MYQKSSFWNKFRSSFTYTFFYISLFIENTINRPNLLHCKYHKLMLFLVIFQMSTTDMGTLLYEIEYVWRRVHNTCCCYYTIRLNLNEVREIWCSERKIHFNYQFKLKKLLLHVSNTKRRKLKRTVSVNLSRSKPIMKTGIQKFENSLEVHINLAELSVLGSQ